MGAGPPRLAGVDHDDVRFVRPLLSRALTGMLAANVAALTRPLEAADQRAGEIASEKALTRVAPQDELLRWQA